MFRLFGAADFTELGVAALLVLFLVLWPRMAPGFQRLAARPRWCFALLTILPIALRLALLPVLPAPVPAGADDFSYLLLADTLTHGRFANPVHPMHRFFEADFILQEPSYSSIYPVGQGLALAAGQVVFGHPWAGVLLSMGALCGGCYWMLRGWVSAEWALAGGTLAVAEFGPLCQWTNLYWGGAVSGIAGCLIFGALPRRAYGWLGVGLALQLLTRPFEFGLVVVAVGIYLVFAGRPATRLFSMSAFARSEANENRGERPPARLAARRFSALVVVLLGVTVMAVQNYQVTGRWTSLPYQLSRYLYGVPATFTFQPNPVPHRALTAEQQLDYAAQAAIHGDGRETFGKYVQRLGERVRFYKFFFLAPLYIVLPAFAWKLREFRYAWVLATVVLLALGSNFYPYFYPHYIAVATCLFVLMAVVSLERVGAIPARVILMVCAGHFLFAASLAKPEADPRTAVNEQLARAPGEQLVFVHYAPSHMFQEWIHNAADINGSRVVWAADLGEMENMELRRYYPHRKAWMVEPDAHPAKLTPIQ